MDEPFYAALRDAMAIFHISLVKTIPYTAKHENKLPTNLTLE